MFAAKREPSELHERLERLVRNREQDRYTTGRVRCYETGCRRAAVGRSYLDDTPRCRLHLPKRAD